MNKKFKQQSQRTESQGRKYIFKLIITVKGVESFL